jgi:hypothetical protein
VLAPATVTHRVEALRQPPAEVVSGYCPGGTPSIRYPPAASVVTADSGVPASLTVMPATGKPPPSATVPCRVYRGAAVSARVVAVVCPSRTARPVAARSS